MVNVINAHDNLPYLVVLVVFPFNIYYYWINGYVYPKWRHTTDVHIVHETKTEWCQMYDYIHVNIDDGKQTERKLAQLLIVLNY